MRSNRLVIAAALAAALSLAVAQSAFAAHAVYSHGSGGIWQTYGADLDTGTFNTSYPAANDDIYFEAVSGTLRYIGNSGTSARILRMASKPGYSACASAALLQRHYNVAKNVGRWFCVQTDQGRMARFRIVSALPSQNLGITFTTWV
jgi:hypothetical protein